MARPRKYATEEEAHRARLESNARRQAERLIRIEVQPEKAEGQAIKDAAKQAGKSTQAYILEAVRQRIAADQAGGHLIYMSQKSVEANAKAKGQTVSDWLADRQAPQK